MRVWSLAIMTIIAGLSGCASFAPFDPVPAPVWEAGYAYAYDLEGSVSASGYAEFNGDRQEIPEEAQTIPRMPFIVYEVLGTQFVDRDDEPIYVAAVEVDAEFPDAVEENPALTQGGLAIRHRDLMPSQLAGFDACGPCELPATEPGLVYLDFPLDDGKTWSSTVDQNGVVTKTSSEAVGLDTVDLGEGPLSAVRVESKVTYRLSDEVREAAKSQGADLDIDGGGTITTWYAPAAKNVVRETADVKVTFDGSGDGFKTHVVIDMDITTTMAGALLDPTGERSKAEVESFLNNNVPVRDPTGRLEVPVGDYQLALTADKDRVNGAESPSVHFTADATGGLPEGHEVTYTVIAPSGQTIDEGSGTEFDVAFEGMGVHAVRVQAFDGETLQAQATRAIYVDHQAELPVDCGPVTIGAAGQACTAISIPVAPGASVADISFDGDRPLPGTLRIVDAAGEAYDISTQNGQADASGLQTLYADGSDWTVQWRPQAGIADGGTLQVDFQYGDGQTLETEDVLQALPFSDLFRQHIDVLSIW